MKNAILSLLMLSLFTSSCQKDDLTDQTPVTQTDKYMSLTAGSTWNYELTDNAASTTTPYTLTSTSKDSSINARSYHVFTNSSGSANEYYNISGNDYYNFRSLPAAFGGSSVENIYLKDNAAVGQTWDRTLPVLVSGVTLDGKITYTITEKGLSKTVKGKVYDNVTGVTTTVAVSIGGTPLPAGAITTDIHAFYAPKYGLIQSVTKIDIDFMGNTDHTDQETVLSSADIK